MWGGQYGGVSGSDTSRRGATRTLPPLKHARHSSHAAGRAIERWAAKHATMAWLRADRP